MASLARSARRPRSRWRQSFCTSAGRSTEPSGAPPCMPAALTWGSVPDDAGRNRGESGGAGGGGGWPPEGGCAPAAARGGRRLASRAASTARSRRRLCASGGGSSGCLRRIRRRNSLRTSRSCSRTCGPPIAPPTRDVAFPAHAPPDPSLDRTPFRLPPPSPPVAPSVAAVEARGADCPSGGGGSVGGGRVSPWCVDGRGGAAQLPPCTCGNTQTRPHIRGTAGERESTGLKNAAGGGWGGAAWEGARAARRHGGPGGQLLRGAEGGRRVWARLPASPPQ